MKKNFKTFFKPFFGLLVACNCLIFSLCGYLYYNLPDDLLDMGTTDMTVAGVFQVTAEKNGGLTPVGRSGTDGSAQATLKLFGAFPIKNATVTAASRSYVRILGTPFGIKIYSDGVMTVGISGVDTSDGNVYPAKDAGIEVGDIVISVNGRSVSSNAALAVAVEACGGEKIAVRIRRDGVERTFTVTPAYSVSEKCFKIGLWVRDSSAGIGTLTFYDPSSSLVAGLGHAITDPSTEDAVPLRKGEMVGAEILGVGKSVSGTPGELHGRFTLEKLGDLLFNGASGVYGTAESAFSADRLYPVASKQEIRTGKAEVLTTIGGCEPELFECVIERVYLGDSGTQNMTVRITDTELLDKAGGIVQGMSGSPIVQNGKLIGAVTHVFVGDTARGYAIFAENMLETAQGVASENKLKDAS